MTMLDKLSIKYLALSLLPIICLMTVPVPTVQAHHPHNRIETPYRVDSNNQDAAQIHPVSFQKELNNDKNFSRPRYLVLSVLIHELGTCGPFDEVHRGKPGKENVPENCCDHCQDVIGQDIFRIKLELDNSYDLLPIYTAYQLPDKKIVTGKKHHPYRDRSPPSLLQGILKHRILLI